MHAGYNRPHPGVTGLLARRSGAPSKINSGRAVWSTVCGFKFLDIKLIEPLETENARAYIEDVAGLLRLLQK